MNSALEPELGVECVNKIVVRLNAAPWPFAIRHKESIRAFWREQQRCHPHFYDGQVHVMIAWEIHNAKLLLQHSSEVSVERILQASYIGSHPRYPQKASLIFQAAQR